MDPHETPDPDRLDPLAPRPDDPQIGRWWGRLYDPARGRRGAPLAILGMMVVAVAAAGVYVLAHVQCG